MNVDHNTPNIQRIRGHFSVENAPLLIFSRVKSVWWILVFCSVLWLGADLGLTVSAHAGKEKRAERRNESDVLFTNSTVPRLKIEMSRTAANSLRRDPRKPVPATLREDGKVVYTNVMVHLKGHWGSMRPFDDKPGLTLNLGDTNGTFHGMKKFHLNNSVQDRTYLSEWICGEVFDAAAVPFPRTAHALVEINERRLGVYVIKEGENRDFFSRYFNDTHGNIYGQSVFGDVNVPLERMGGHEEDTTRQDLKRLTAACRETNPDRLREQLTKTLDVERFISFMAVEMMLCDWDGYTRKVHNYRVYHNMDEDKMVFIPHDKDQMMEDPNAPIYPKPAAGLVAAAVLRVPEYRQHYKDRFNEIFTNVFVPSVLNQRIDEKTAKLAAAVEDYDSAIARSLRANSRNLKSRITRRAFAIGSMLKIPNDPGTTLQFVNNIAKLKGWYSTHDFEGATLERVEDPPGKACLAIHANVVESSDKCDASWRTKVAIEPGHYVFEGMVRCAGIVPTADPRRGQGAGLRISGLSRERQNKLEGDSPWKKVSFEFQVEEHTEEITLVCDLIATQGKVWFEEDSLHLRRLE